jgi:Pyruvate/2-oxoacid:ferredoxin oxidoreductase delta subunit
MIIKDCGGCGNCQDFKCPEEAFNFATTSVYASASIDEERCTDCGLCKTEIDCLCEAIQYEEE